MAQPRLYALIESRAHPNLTALYRRPAIDELKFSSVRNVLMQLKRQPPDWIVADFSHGYANNYAGVNRSNPDVLPAGLRRDAPQGRVVVRAEQAEYRYVDKLGGCRTWD